MKTNKVKIAYKVFDSNWTCRDKQYKVGKTFEITGELILCENGIHYCNKLADCFSYYSFNPANKVAEVKILGDVITNRDKSCTNKLRLIRELSWHEVLELVNTGKDNSGYCNTGHNNSGYYNTGNNNSGYYNTGNNNSGYNNSGYYNTGNNNSGYYNTGNNNTGNANLGHHNTGNYNLGNHNTGSFNTNEPNVRLFDKDTGKKSHEIDLPYISLPSTEWVKYTDAEMEADAKKAITKGYFKPLSYKESWKIAWEEASPILKQKFLDLPGFDAEIFAKITGIKVKKPKIKKAFEKLIKYYL